MTLYTSKVIAQWLCLTERRVRQLRDEGVIVEARPGLYELQPTVARYIKYLGGAGKESLNTERMKLTAEKRKAAEMDNDLRRGDLHSTQDIEKGIQTMCLNIRSRFLAMPAKLLKSSGMKTLPGAGGMSKGFLVKFSSGHVGMVQRRIGSKSSHTRTAKGYKRWTNAKGNVEKLVTMGSPSATAMHHTIWPEVEPSVEEYLQERLQAQVERVLARAGKK